jgi:16S rRNA (uracil1498-N3)-methyltransferase
VRRRFFVDKFHDHAATMDGEAAHHLGRVLRAQTGQLYELSDGRDVWLARIENVTRDRVDFALTEQLPAAPSTLDITLLLSIVKFDAFEWAIEKATELGVTAIIPVAAARSEKALIAAAAKRAVRWSRVLLEASQQSRRLRVPILRESLRAAQAFAANSSELNLMLSERGDAPPLREILKGRQAVNATLAIGPEGGWTDEEFAAAVSAGFREVSLGHLILRAETAVISALSCLNYALG